MSCFFLGKKSSYTATLNSEFILTTQFRVFVKQCNPNKIPGEKKKEAIVDRF
jgi:hypothetical protein